MGWIGVEPTGNITPRASEQTSLWSFITRDLGQPLQERRQMTAVMTLTGALSDRPTAWHAINWYAVHRQVRRLQARMVKAVQAKRWGKVHALQLTFRTPSDGDPRIFSAARFARTAHSNRDMVSSHERRYVTHLCLRSVVWGSCCRPSKPTRSNICPL